MQAAAKLHETSRLLKLVLNKMPASAVASDADDADIAIATKLPLKQMVAIL